MVNDIIKRRERIKKIAEKYNLFLVLIFGSVVNGKIHQDSDFDIGVLSEKEVNLKKYSQIYFDLSKVFKGRDIDLVFINHADPLFLKKILENCQILYGSKRTLNLLKIYAFKQYCDYKKYLDLERKFVHQFIKEF